MYSLYSFKVVAPITLISPRASIGFIIFEASIEPSVLPAPTIVWSSSINIIICPSDFFTSSITDFNLSSNCPLYFAPATKLAISRAKIVLPWSGSGTSLFTILWARPSTIAVLPTPGWPIKTGLFFFLLERILWQFLISVSRPITGSIFPSLASFVKFLPYFSKGLFVSSGLSFVTFWPFLTFLSSFEKFLAFNPISLK